MKMIFFQQLLTKGKFDLTFRVFMVYNAIFLFKTSLIIFVGIGVSSLPMAENNKVHKIGNKLFYIEAKKDLFFKGLV